MKTAQRAVPVLLALLLAACGGNGGNGGTGAGADAPVNAAAGQAQGPSGGGPRSVAIARGKIEVQGGLVELSAPTDGIVESIAVAEGDTVRKGQTLLRLDADGIQQNTDVAEAELKAAQARQQAQAVRLPAARQFAARLAEAAAAGGIDHQRADDATQAAREIEASAAVAAAEVQVAQSKVSQSKALLNRLVLSAPVDATVVRMAVQTGTRVDAQSTHALMVLLPNRPLQVRAELNESFAGAIRPGMLADVTVDSTAGAAVAPRQAKVVRVAPLVGPTRLEDDGSAPRAGQRVVDCFLVFDAVPAAGAHGAVAWRVGQNVRVNFHE